MEVERQGDQSAKEFAAELGHDALADDAQQVGLEETADRLHAEQPDQGEDQPIQAPTVAAGHDLRGDPGDDQGEGQPHGGGDDQADQRDGERPPLRAQVAEQASPGHATKAAHLADHGGGIGRDSGELLGHRDDDVSRGRRTRSRSGYPGRCARRWGRAASGSERR